jgi:hypothetical protein
MAKTTAWWRDYRPAFRRGDVAINAATREK